MSTHDQASLDRSFHIRTKQLGHMVPIAHGEYSSAREWMGIASCSTSSELGYLARDYLGANGYVKVNSCSTSLDVTVTPQGFAYLEQLRSSGAESNIGFCAMWFEPTVDVLWNDAIDPAIRDAGYDSIRIDRVHHNNKIDDEIVANLRRCKFVVADFTGQRGGVYFESGFALALGRPVIWTVKKSDLNKVHFDTRQYNFLEWRDNGLAELRGRLQLRIEATLGRGKND